MGVLVDFLQVQSKPVRDLAARRLNKDENRRLASRFDVEYFDGTREQGYGGYRYDGRWVPVAHRLIDHSGLRPGARVLDIGCAKGFLVDRKSVVEGKRVSVRVDIGGRRIIKKKKNTVQHNFIPRITSQ